MNICIKRSHRISLMNANVHKRHNRRADAGNTEWIYGEGAKQMHTATVMLSEHST